ncbi:hypothetical protein LguiB_028580 [Lonicera macranthoides]
MDDEPLPDLFSASTGAGTHKFAQGLSSAFGSHVRKFGAPFRQSEKAGFFLATREDLESWVKSRAQALGVLTGLQTMGVPPTSFG